MDENLHDEQFDELLRSKYQGEEIAPPGMLWKVISKGLPQNEVQSPGSSSIKFLWPIAGLTALITGVIIYFSFLTDHEKAVVKKENPQMVIEKKSHNLQLGKTIHPGLLKNEKLKNENPSVKKGISGIAENNKGVAINKDEKPANVLVSSSQTITDSKTHSSDIEYIQKLSPRGVQLSASAFLQPDTIAHIPSFSGNTRRIDENIVENPISVNQVKLKREKRFSVELLAKPMASFRFLTDNPAYPATEFNKSYFDNRDKYAITFGYGLQFAYQINPRISLKLGFSMSNYASHFNTNYSAVIHNGKYEADIYTSSGLASIHIISSDTISKQDLLKSSMNISYFNIPVGINYLFAKFLYMGAGLNFGFNMGQEMNWDATDYNGSLEIQTEKINGIEKFTLGFLLEAGVRAKIYKNLSFSAAPVFQVNIMTINKSATVKSFPYSLGLQVGLRYDIF
jgi:hypothetical protein